MTDDSQTQQTAEDDPTLVDPSELRREQFEPLLGQTFKVPLSDGGHIGMELVEVNKTLCDAEFGERRGFRLTLKGPMEPHFVQGNIKLESPDGRSMILFAVNNGPKDGGHMYQVVVS